MGSLKVKTASLSNEYPMHFRCIPLYLVYSNGICTSLNKWALNINKLFIIQEEFKSIHWIILNNKYNKDLVSGCNIGIYMLMKLIQNKNELIL